MSTELRDRLASLLRRTAEAHHEAFIDADGADPDWPIWYAEHAHGEMTGQFGFSLSKAELIECLLKADVEHRARASDRDWAEFYAELFLEHLAPASGGEAKLALYYSDGCPFCITVRRVIKDLGVDVEMRNIFNDKRHRDDLVAARGRATVPVLRIVPPVGEERWMPESRDIARFLQQMFG